MSLFPKISRRLSDGYAALAFIAVVVFVVTELRSRFWPPEGVGVVVDDVPPDSVGFSATEAWREPDSVFVNTASPAELHRSGFSYYFASQIVYRREQGRYFFSAQDLLQIWYADSDLVRRLEPRMVFRLPSAPRPIRTRAETWRREEPVLGRRVRRVPLFLADSAALIAAGMSSDAWDTLSAFRSRCVLGGSMAFDSLVSVSASELSSILKGRVVAVRERRVPREAAVAPSLSVVELNGATVEQLVELPGVGQRTAERIVEFRRSLGGFVSPRQLVGLWPITDEAFHAMSPYLEADSARVSRVNVNSSNDTRMRRHPYFPPLLVSRLWQLKFEGGGRALTPDDVRRCAEGVELSPFFWSYVSYSAE